MHVVSTKIYDEMKNFSDLDTVVRTVLRENSEMTRADVEYKLDALLQWFSVIPLAQRDGKSLQMLSNIDRVWHAFILNTRIYAQFCIKYLGRMVHHDETTAMDSSAPRREYADYTLTILQKEFGSKLNPELEMLQFDVKCCSHASD